MARAKIDCATGDRSFHECETGRKRVASFRMRGEQTVFSGDTKTAHNQDWLCY